MKPTDLLPDLLLASNGHPKLTDLANVQLGGMDYRRRFLNTARRSWAVTCRLSRMPTLLNAARCVPPHFD